MADAEPVPFTASATPTLLTLSNEASSIEICFQGPDRLRIRGHNAALRLIADGAWLVPYQQDHWEINTSAVKYMVFPIQSDINVSTANNEGSSNKVLTLSPKNGAPDFEAELDAYTSGWQFPRPRRKLR